MKKISLLITLIAFYLFQGCSPNSETIKPHTETILPAPFVDIQWRGYLGKESGSFPFTPDESYHVVNSKWLFQFYNTWRKEMFDLDVLKWAPTFDCNKFSAAFCSRAQIEYYRETYGRPNSAQALAVGEIWYIPDKSKTNHSIVAAITERGVVFLEPQTGKELKLSKEEIFSIYYKRF